MSFCLFVAAKKAIPIGGQKGVVFVFFFLGLLKKTNPIGWHKGCVFCFCGASKKNNRRAQGLCFCFFGGLPKKTNALGGHKGCVFSFLVLPEKTIGGHRGCVFPFLMLQKNKSNRRAQGSCFCFFLGFFGVGFQKKQIQ